MRDRGSKGTAEVRMKKIVIAFMALSVALNLSACLSGGADENGARTAEKQGGYPDDSLASIGGGGDVQIIYFGSPG